MRIIDYFDVDDLQAIKNIADEATKDEELPTSTRVECLELAVSICKVLSSCYIEEAYNIINKGRLP